MTTTVRQSKSWVELSYDTDSEEENDEQILSVTQTLVKKTQSEQLPELSLETPQLSQSTHSIESSDQLPRYYVRLLKMVEQSMDTVFEVVIRGCPSNIRTETLQGALPFIECKITSDLVRVFLKKNDLVDLIQQKQLTIKINNEEFGLIVQRHSEEVTAIEKKLQENEKNNIPVQKQQNRTKKNLQYDLIQYGYKQKGKKINNKNQNNHYRYKRDE